MLVPMDVRNKIAGEPNTKKNTIRFATSKEKIVQAIDKGMKNKIRIEKGKLAYISLGPLKSHL